MSKLNLPSFTPKIQRKDGKLYIFDTVRRRYVRLTPEEWVRQHVIHWLLQQQYPPGLMQVERMHQQHGLHRRSDLLVFDRQARPFLLVECKAPHLNLSESDTRQLLTYNTHFGAPYLMLTNGMNHHLWHKTEDNYHTIKTLPDFPSAQ
ncbi:MAG: type I restriction enzyme HsdR N-terminal domain-containing protein [Bernardetiaceae bacterium]